MQQSPAKTLNNAETTWSLTFFACFFILQLVLLTFMKFLLKICLKVIHGILQLITR